MVNQCTKFEVSSCNHSGDILGWTENLMGHMIITMPLSGLVCHPWAGTSNKLCTKFEISTFTHYEDMKGDRKYRNWGGLGLGVTQGHRQHSHLVEHI